mgnify:CR=1 FL=1
MISETQAAFLALTFIGAAALHRLFDEAGLKHPIVYGAAASLLFFGGVVVFQAPPEKAPLVLAACAAAAIAYVTIAAVARLLKL